MKIKFNMLLALTLLVAPLAWSQAGLNSKMSSAEPKAVKFLVVTLTTGTAVQASTTNLQFTTATFYGYKAVSDGAAPTANTGTAYLGFVDGTGASGLLAGDPVFIETITAGGSTTLAPIGTKYNLMDIYFLGTTGDKVVIAYTQ